MSAIPADCVARVAEVLGAKANAQALKYVREQLTKFSPNEPGSAAQKLASAAQRFQQQTQLAAVILKRNAVINANLYQRHLSYILTVWKGKEAEGMRALLTGSIEGRRGARLSAGREQQVLNDLYMGGFYTELEREKLVDLFASGAVDRDVARALWQMNLQSPNFKGLAKEAVGIAKIINKYQELARADANKAGAWIGKLDGWIVRQSHDSYKITKAGFQAWATEIGPRLDWNRIEMQQGPIADKAGWLHEVYIGLESGSHLKAGGAETTSGFVGPSNLAKKMSQDRVLHFKDADNWFEYNQAFGVGNIREAVIGGLRKSAKNTGLMRVFGTNPEAMFTRLSEGVVRQIRSDAKATRKFNAATADQGWLTNRLMEVTGQASIPVNQEWARIGANVRAVESMAKLGSATLASFGDVATYASEMRFQGRGFLSGMGDAIGGLLAGRPKGEHREMLAGLGVFFDSMVGELSRVGSLDETLGGSMSRGMRTYFKLNLLDWWTDSLRSSAALSMSHTLALRVGTRFADLPAGLRQTFKLFDIDEAHWNAMKAGVREAGDGRVYLTADNLPANTAEKLRRFINDRAYQAVLEPDADTRAMLRHGTRSGTASGELWRFIAQFKSYGVGYARQVVGREIYGHGEKAFASGAVGGLAQLIVASTIIGYGSMVAKDLAKGRTPRDPLAKSTVIAAFLQGGGAGIYGDYLFGQYSRFGATPLETAAGPTLGAAADVLQLFARWREGDAGAAEAMRLAVNNTPFINMFYSRALLDYLVLYHIQEAINPGAMRRMERRMEKEQHQTFLVPPSEVVQ